MNNASNLHTDLSNLISEVSIVPIKPAGGIVGFASFVFDNSIFLGSIAIVTRPNGGYRLLYPTRKVGTSNLNIFYPISREVGQQIERVVIALHQDVLTKGQNK